MTKEIIVTYSQEDIRMLIGNDLFAKGYVANAKDFKYTVCDPKSVPSGATPGDVISVTVNVKEKTDKPYHPSDNIVGT